MAKAGLFAAAPEQSIAARDELIRSRTSDQIDEHHISAWAWRKCVSSTAPMGDFGILPNAMGFTRQIRIAYYCGSRASTHLPCGVRM
jgi:hypothetical protein